MKPTKHATTNFRMLKPFLDGLSGGTHRRYEDSGYMPLVVEELSGTPGNKYTFSIAHYGYQNGDAMRDPDMEVEVDFAAGTVDPLYFRNDYMGIEQNVYIYQNGKRLYSPRLRTDLDDFLWHWLKNIHDQGFAKAI